MKYYRAGMFSLVLIPLMLTPIIYLSFREMDNRVLKFSVPTTTINSEDPFSIYHLYENVLLDSFLLDTMNLVSIDLEFDKLSCFKSDSLFLSKNLKIFKKGITFRISSKNNYESLINLINLSEKHGLKFYGLDIKNDNFIVIQEFEHKNKESLGFFCGYRNYSIVKNISSINKILTFVIEKWIILSDNTSFQFVLPGYLILAILSFLINLRF